MSERDAGLPVPFVEWLRLSADGAVILAIIAFPALAIYRLLRARFTIPLP